MIISSMNLPGDNMSKLKIGVFGAGRGRTMVSQLLDRDDAELVAVCDKYVPALRSAGEMAENHGLKVALYENFEDFFRHPMDAVVLANYANEHAPFAVRFLESGRHVLSECLTCATMKEAVELIEAVEKSGLVYGYAENVCYFATAYEMMRRYRRGDIGELMQAECEYIHDCTPIWPLITYGDRTHWRNRMSSVFYCTHSLGPIMFSTGLRPVRVSGFETRAMDYTRNVGTPAGSAGTLIVTLENGAIVKSIDMNLRRGHSINFQMYGDRGMMETDRFREGTLHVRTEPDGKWEEYDPPLADARAEGSGHGGCDFFSTHYFIESILGIPEGRENLIDVYSAVDMCIPGILGFRSIVNGGVPVEIPDLRNPAERDAFRNDTFCTFPEIGGDMYVPCSAAQKNGCVPIPDEVYEKVRKQWENKQ